MLEWKIDCDALTYADMETMAVLITRRVGAFSRVEGVPRGGLRLADILSHYTTPNGPLLIVDDVCTTGRSLETQRAGRNAMGYVIFSRDNLPKWCQTVFTYNA